MRNLSQMKKRWSQRYGDYATSVRRLQDNGLMIYGSGVEIPSGKAGRWHKERLHLSPFIYRAKKDGSRQWNADFKEGGHYYDPIYGDKVIRFGNMTK